MKKAGQFLIPLAAALLVTMLVWIGTLGPLDRWVQDALFQQPDVPSTDIMIVGIDELALDMYGPYHTWDRSIMASALEALAADPDNLPAAVAIDVNYAGHTSPESDDRLARAAAALGCTITATIAEYGNRTVWENGHAVAFESSAIINYKEPYEALRAGTTQGHINVMPDTDGIVRHALLYVEPEPGQRVWSMAYEAAHMYAERNDIPLNLPETIGKGHFYVAYTGHPGDYYEDISIAALIAGAIPPGYWANKIVLIGPYATALQDTYFSAMDKAEPMYGVEIQANVIQAMIDGRYKTEVADMPQLAILFVLCAAGMFCFRRMKLWQCLIVFAVLVLIGFGLPYLLYPAGFVTHPLWLPSAAVILLLAAMLERFRRTIKERQALALEKERISAELSLATRIQASALPKTFPPFPDRHEFDIYASMTPAKEVGGDFYDFFMIDEDHLGLVIGDVSGKGVPASLFMMVAMALIRHVCMRESSPAKVLQSVNTEICARNPEEMFVTVWLGILEISTGKLVAANAGHEFPALRKADGHFELFKDRHGFVVGGMAGVRYREYELQMEPGDKIFVYTDGVAEATNSSEELFGTDRMLEALRRAEDAPPAGILESVSKGVQDFVGTAPQFDDLTMLCLHYKAAPPAAAPAAE